MSESFEIAEEKDPDLPKYSEWKSWYRLRVLDWLMVHKDYQYEGIEKSLQQIRQNPGFREAAVALFWDVYLGEKDPRPDETRIRNIQALLSRELGCPDKEEERHMAFVKFLLAGTLAVSLIIPGDNLAEDPTIVKALETASIVGDRLESIEGNYDREWGRKQLDGDVFLLSLVLVDGITNFELALYRQEEGKYEEAFYLIFDAICELSMTTFWSFDPHPGRERAKREKRRGWRLLYNVGRRQIEYLPHSRGMLEPQDVIDIFKKLRAHPDRVRDWSKVRRTCRCLVDRCDWGLANNQGGTLEEMVYWEKAETFAASRLSPDQLRTLRDEDEREGAEQRICRDFFYDLWSDLSPSMREALIDAERHWGSRLRPQYDHMTSAYREAFEEIFKTHFPFLAKKARRKLDPTMMPWLPQLPADRIPKNFLSKMSISLEYDPSVISWVKRSLNGDENRNFFRRTLPKCLRQLVEVRNYYEHRDTHQQGIEENIILRARKIRCEILGIRCEESIVRRLWQLREI